MVQTAEKVYENDLLLPQFIQSFVPEKEDGMTYSGGKRGGISLSGIYMNGRWMDFKG